jgi:hypothetical protein
MSLRAFHILFIVLAFLLALLCAAWAFVNGVSPMFGIASVVVAVGLAIYGVWFLWKTKSIIL